MQHKHLIFVLWFLLLLSACDLMSNNQTVPEPTATPTPTPVVTPILQSTPAIAVPITATETTPSLTIWIPPGTVLGSEAGAALFSDQLLMFNANHPDLETHVEQKTVAGQGGILSYLRTGSTVAPSILPDLIALPTNQLATAVTEGLVYPLNDLIEPALFDDLYPAAKTMAQVGEQYYGYPFAITNLTHLAYQTSVITTTPPLRWNDLAANTDTPFIFPAAGPAAARLTLQFYLAGGGALTNEAGQPALDESLVLQALQPFQDGRSSSFILLQSSNTTTLEESWAIFQAGTAVYTLTDAHQFLLNRTPEVQPGFAVIPGLSIPLIPIVDGWAWAITTADPTQRALAAELLLTLIEAPNLAQWSRQSSYLPARREALNDWPADAYVNFIKLELERAQANPAGSSEAIMNVLGDAVFDVVSFAKTAPEAAAEAVSALQP